MTVADTGRLLAAASAFDLGVAIGPPTLVARGAMGEVYRLDTTAGAFAIKRLFDWNLGDGADVEARFTAAARNHGIVTPIEIPTSAGAYVPPTDMGRLRAFSWVEVATATLPPRAPDVLARFGQIMGTLHAIAPASGAAIDDWYLRPPSEDSWPDLVEAAGKAGMPWAPMLAANLASIGAATQYARAPVVGEARLCHRDLDPTNVLPIAGGGLVVLDWENLGPLPPDREVAVAVFDWTADGPAQDDEVRAIRDGYRAAGGTVERLDAGSFATLFATNLNHVHGQVDAVLDPVSTDADREYAHEVIPKLIPQPSDFVRVEQLVQVWNETR